MEEQRASDYPQTQKSVGGGSSLKAPKPNNGVQGWRQVKTHLELNLESHKG